MTNHDYVSTIQAHGHDGMPSWKAHFGQADLVIEAVFEEISVKHKVLAEMEEVLPERNLHQHISHSHWRHRQGS